MRLIDADRLVKHTKFYTLKNGNRAIDEVDILHAQTVPAIPLDKVKQARKEIEQLSNANPTYWITCDVINREDVLEILDNLIESEG